MFLLVILFKSIIFQVENMHLKDLSYMNNLRYKKSRVLFCIHSKMTNVFDDIDCTVKTTFQIDTMDTEAHVHTSQINLLQSLTFLFLGSSAVYINSIKKTKDHN